MVWGRDAEKLKKYASNMDYLGLDMMGCFILSATCAWSYSASNYVSQTNLKVGIIYGDSNCLHDVSTEARLITRRAEFHGLCPWVNEKAAI